MNTSTNQSKAEKAPNYSAEQEQTLIQSDPISYETACSLASDWGKSSRSVISKIKSMGLGYIPKPKPAKKVSKGDTKAELVAKIETALDATDMLVGLEKATASALVNLLGCAKVFQHEMEDLEMQLIDSSNEQD